MELDPRQQRVVIGAEYRRSAIQRVLIEPLDAGRGHPAAFVPQQQIVEHQPRERVERVAPGLPRRRHAGGEAGRVEQLERFDIRHRVLCNRGGKGRPVLELIETMKPSAAVFVDDLSIHHESVAKHAPAVWRLHMIAEPRLAGRTPPAPDAHARIDQWPDATEWILARLREGPAEQA